MTSFRLAVCFVLVASSVYAQKSDVESCTPSSPIVVDADFSEWTTEWSMDSKGKFAYNICNDDANLYVRIKVSDDIVQRKIGLLGFTVYLNPKGKKMGKMGLKYPVPKDLEELKKKTADEAQSAGQMEKAKMDLVREEEVLELLGLSKAPIVSSRLGLMNGIEVIIRPDDHSNYVYEAKIPFKAFKIDKASVKALGVTFATGKLDAPKPAANAPPGGGAGNAGYASRYGMGYNPGYGRSSMPPWSEWNAATILSLAVKLK